MHKHGKSWRWLAAAVWLAVWPLTLTAADFDGDLHDLWPVNGMPGAKAQKAERQRLVQGRVEIIFNVSAPVMTVFPAVSGSGPSPAVIVCPGGGYGVLAYTKEGTEIAAWLNSIGITGIVLKYRVSCGREAPFQDVQRAVRLARQHAGEWGLDPARVGVLGFSAGGHLAARLSVNSGQPAYAAVDEADALSCRPDFAVLVYPAYLETAGRLSPEFSGLNAALPPTFIIHTEDDERHVPGSKTYAAALATAGATHEFLLLAEGGHGYGLRSDKEIKIWPVRCAAWLRKIKVLPETVTP